MHRYSKQMIIPRANFEEVDGLQACRKRGAPSFCQISLPYLNQGAGGGTLCPPHYYVPPQIFRPCDGPGLWLRAMPILPILICRALSLLMPSPSANSKFVLSVLKFLGLLNFFQNTQNVLSILKWFTSCSKISLLSIHTKKIE